MTEKKRINKITVLLIVLLLLVASVAVVFFIRSNRQKKETETRLGAVQMELVLRQLSEQAREEQVEKAEESAKKEQQEKTALMKSLLERDRKEILMLVNPWNSIDPAYSPRLVAIGDELYFDERAAGALEAFLTDCRLEGWAPCPLSAYRTMEYQQKLFDDKAERVYQSGGYEREEAYIEAAKEVAVPGTSEHQTGLAVDIVDEYYPNLDESQVYSSTQQWMMAHCTEYGFILRFPEDREDVTGIIYEPWHYRYVGKEVAKTISERGITFEEYYNTYVVNQ